LESATTNTKAAFVEPMLLLPTSGLPEVVAKNRNSASHTGLELASIYIITNKTLHLQALLSCKPLGQCLNV